MGYSYVYPPLAKDAKQTPAQSRSAVSSQPLPPKQLKPQRNKPPVTIQKFRTEKSPRKPIFPDLKPPREFKNFMSPMNHKFPFQIAKKRDGLIGNIVFKRYIL